MGKDEDVASILHHTPAPKLYPISQPVFLFSSLNARRAHHPLSTEPILSPIFKHKGTPYPTLSTFFSFSFHSDVCLPPWRLMRGMPAACSPAHPLFPPRVLLLPCCASLSTWALVLEAQRERYGSSSTKKKKNFETFAYFSFFLPLYPILLPLPLPSPPSLHPPILLP